MLDLIIGHEQKVFFSFLVSHILVRSIHTLVPDESWLLVTFYIAGDH